MTTIEHISDTARWVAVYRAMESERDDAIFRDPFAARLAGERGLAIVDGMRNGRGQAWAMIVRTAVLDEMILECVSKYGIDLVVNLAAGLDARAWRMPLPKALRWVDVDLPAILEYKTDVLQNETPACRYEAVPLDLRDGAKRRALFTQLGHESKRALVISEGLLIYLTAEYVGALAADLRATPAFDRWLLDLANPRLLAILRRNWSKDVRAGTAPFQFAPGEGTKFFAPFGWTEALFRSSIEEARRLNREMQAMWFWRLLSRLSSRGSHEEFRRMSGIVLLARSE